MYTPTLEQFTLKLRKFFIFSLLGILFSLYGHSLRAQYSPLYYMVDTAKESKNVAQVNFQALFEVNTQTLISGGFMNANGDDIRFFTGCNSGTPLDYYIESGINTSNTRIWVRIPAIGANASLPVFMCYGDPVATAASNFNATFPNSLLTNGNNVTLGGVQDFDCIRIDANDTLFITNGTPADFSADLILVAATGYISGKGLGHPVSALNTAGVGPGAGSTSGNAGSGGGSYGGVGGTGGFDAGDTPGTGGPSYGTLSGSDFDMGSSGGSGTTQGGSGGGAIRLTSTLIQVDGGIDAEGNPAINSASASRAGGGGAGGCVLVNACKISGTGTITVNGGMGGSGTSTANDGGGGGAAGRIKLFSINIPTLFTNANGGAGGLFGTGGVATAGGNGTIHTGSTTLVASVSGTHQAFPTVNASSTPSPATICAGSSISLTGVGTASTYTWSNGVNTPLNGISFTPAGTGTSTYTVTGTDANGCTRSSTLDLSINALPVVSANASPSNTVNSGSSLTLFGGGASTYTWSGPQAVSNNVSFNATPAATGIYTVTGIDGNNCSNTATINITVSGPIPFSVNSLIWGSSPFQDSIWSVDTTTWSVVHRLAPSLAGFTITGITGLAFDPCEFKTYAILKLSGVSGRTLATIDLSTAVCTLVGNFGTGGNFSSITFREDGQLFGSTGNGAGAPFTPEALYMINKTNASTTLATVMGAGADGEIICYNPADDFIYHWSGNGTVVFEKLLSVPPYTATNIPISGTPGGETFGALCLNPGTFLISNIASTFKYLSSTGQYGANNLISLPDDLRGLVMPPSFGTDKDTVCQKVESVQAASSAAQWYTVYYSWGDGTIDTVTGNGTVSHAYQTGGNKTLHVLLWNGTCTADTIWSKSIFVKNTPTVTISGNAAFCQGDSTLLTGSTGGSSQWYFNGALLPGATGNTLFASQAGLYNMFKTNLNGCGDSAAVGTQVTMNLNPSVSGLLTPAAACVNSIAIPNGAGALTYVWTGGLAEAQPFTAAPGLNTYTVTGTDGNGCTATATAQITGLAASGLLPAANSNASQFHGDGLNASYYDGSCNLIASIHDGAGGNVLGMTNAVVNLLAGAGFHNGQPFVRRWYQITPTSNGSADVQLYFTQADFDDYNAVVVAPYLPLPTGPADLAGIANIRITKNADAGLGNSPLEITPVVTWNGSYWVLSFNTPGFSQFRIHSANPGGIALSAMVTRFEGYKQHSSNQLEWTTASEENNDYFELEYSTNGVEFSKIAQLGSQAANGHSATPINYQFVHEQPASGHNYYRLRQVDRDQRSSYHAKVVDLLWGGNGTTVSVYPNPAKEVLHIDLYANTTGQAILQLRDLSGRITRQIQTKTEAGMNQVIMDCQGIARGVYTLQVFEQGKLSLVTKIELSK